MKLLTAFCQIIIAVMCMLSSCSIAQTSSSRDIQRIDSQKVLIVYLSRTKNTQAVAQMIYENVGGKLVQLELKDPYPADYQTTVSQVVKENETNFLPPLKTTIDSIKKYDIIFLGFPTWGMQLPPPIKTFLKQYDLSTKTIVPFNTNAGYGVGSSFETVKQLANKSKVVEGFSIKGGVEQDGILFVMEGQKEVEVRAAVKTWLFKIGFSQ